MDPGAGALELYDVQADPAESRNLAAARPGLVKTMEGSLRDWQKSVERSLSGADYR